jgi:hypothetical protein
VDPGKVIAHMTAKMVIASAARLIDVRHFCRKRKRIAEISVPACPMPTQNTKFVMSHDQPTGVEAPDADPFPEEPPDRDAEQARGARVRGGRGATSRSVSAARAAPRRPR